jgi:hypothetical protein
MSWHKIAFPSTTDDNPDVLKIGQLAGEGFFRADKPQGFGMYHAKRGVPNQPDAIIIVYLSPVACEVCPEIFESYKFEPCEAPALNEQDIAFVIGDPWSKTLLQEWYGGKRPLTLSEEERQALTPEQAETIILQQTQTEVPQAQTEAAPQTQSEEAPQAQAAN